MFRAVLIDWSDDENPPEWMPGKLCEAGIDYSLAPCESRQALLEKAAQAQAVVTSGNVRLLTAENMDALPDLVAIVRMGAGVDEIDVQAARERGIVVANTPDAVTESVSDHAIALLLAAVRRIPQQDRLVKRGVWSRLQARPGVHLRGATLGLVGFGRVGRDVAAKLAGFGMKVLVHDPLVGAAAVQKLGAESVSLEELLKRSRFVSVHCPLTESTRGLIGERELRMMHPEAVLVNTSRGAVIDETALNRALREGWIAAAALDVLEIEPPDRHNPLLELDQVILSPHLAAISDLFPAALWRAVYETLVDLASHRWPRSAVNRAGLTPRWHLA